MTTNAALPATLRALGVADIVPGITGVVTSSWLADQLDLPTGLVLATAVFLVAFGIASVAWAERRAMIRATVAVEGVSALTLVGVAIAGTTTTGLVIALLLVGWCATAALTVTALGRPQPTALVTT